MLFRSDGKRMTRVALRGRKTVVSTFLEESLHEVGIPVARGASALTLQVGDSGDISVGSGGEEPLRFEDPSALIAAVRMLVDSLDEKDSKDAEIELDELELAMILQPPRRLLSETTSKRLAMLFGMATPKEKLCRSPSEAVRFSRAIDGPAVLKLVKPRLDHKAAIGAVIMDVSGDAHTRRSAGELETLGETLGPPAPLGVLVAKQIPDGARISMEMCVHPSLGRLVLGHKGETFTERPAAALSVPASKAEAHRVLLMTGLSSGSSEWKKLARGLSLFSRMVYELGLQIDRAEIHPLAATSDQIGRASCSERVSSPV